jgi:hypothetical protein
MAKKLVQRSIVERFIEAVQKAPARESDTVTHREAIAMATPAIKSAMKDKNLSMRDVSAIAKQVGLEIPTTTVQTYVYQGVPEAETLPTPARKRGTTAAAPAPAPVKATGRKTTARKAAPRAAVGKKRKKATAGAR